MNAIAQDGIRQRLMQQLAAGRVPHALLFCGPEGCGKLAMAVEFAQALIEHGADERGRRMAEGLVHPDLHFVFPVFKPEGASSAPTSDMFLPQWRERLAEGCYFDLPTWTATLSKEAKKVQIYAEESGQILHKLNLTSSQGGYKVMVVWLPEMMHETCANKMLKILEEPPAHLMFILATTELHKVPATIKSRCQQFSFKRILPGDIAAQLSHVAQAEQIPLTTEGAALLARLADGGLRDALSLLDQCTTSDGPVDEAAILTALGLAGNLETAALMANIADGDTSATLERMASLYAAGKADSIADGVKLAAEMIDSGKAAAKVEQFAKASNEGAE